ncbi:uncharacterized protein B0P05DRAFT_551340 [Gilbertella persicaria]|uniref:uncharacterized protein n=1 Tax=Gilbertella persicaria TaxID=101096 RepID=UPI00221E45D8|nr:uncharacterized protein B0P05DRAFT_551340 [Gilbertella persicaria]KAI8069048.1 hypothetical protein B0P05DRAFT_551340 [Gilbertella persicaria]
MNTLVIVLICIVAACFVHRDSYFSQFFKVLFHHWSNIVKSILSLSLSTKEQSIFEEEFKYLIVTSSLFNQTPQLEQPVHHKATESILSDIKARPKQDKFSQKDLIVLIAGMSITCAILSVILRKHNLLLLLFGLVMAYMSSCYFSYRHYRHIQIRRIHVSALDSMHEIIALSKESDALLIRLLKTFHSHQHEEQQQTFGTLLSSHFETYIETVQQLKPLIDSHNLSRLRDMYNINKEIPSILLEFESHQYSMEDIDLIYSVIGWKRREYLLYLLALDVMSNNRATHYGKNWRQAIQVNKGLVNEYNEFNKKLLDLSMMVDNDHPMKDERPRSVSSVSTLSDDTTDGMSDERTLTLMHRVSALEKYVEDIQAELFLCKQDTRSLASGRVSVFSLERISKRFNHIDENMSNLASQWEEGKQSLNVLLEHEQLKLKTTLSSLPSPPISPIKESSNNQEDHDTNSSLAAQLNRCRSFNVGKRRPLSQTRLQRVQSLKTKNSNRRSTLPSNL